MTKHTSSEDLKNINNKNIKSLNSSLGLTKNLRPFGTSVDNFYITDFICENSAIMAKASKVRLKNTFFKDKSLYN